MNQATRTPDGWRTQAACLRHDPQLFTDPRPDSHDTDRALTICRSCPVRQPCLTEALSRPAEADVGIWGATTPEARTRLRHLRASPVSSPPEVAGLFHTLDGDLADLTGRALVVRLPAPPHYLVFIDQRPSLRTNQLDDAWHHIAATIDELQPHALAPYTLTVDGEITDPTGRILITRLPTAPHLLMLVDDRPYRRAAHLPTALKQATAALRPPAGHRLPPAPNHLEDTAAARPDALARAGRR